MAIIAVQVQKFEPGATGDIDRDCFWLLSPDETTVPLTEEEKGNAQLTHSWQSPTHKFTATNYAITFDAIYDEFCGMELDGTGWEINAGGIDELLGITVDDYEDSWRAEALQAYIDIAEKFAAGWLAKNGWEGQNYWAYRFHTAWTFWSTQDYFGEYDCGSELAGVVDIGDPVAINGKLYLAIE